MAEDKGKELSGASSGEIEKYLDLYAKDPQSRVFAPLAEAYRKAGLLDDAIEIAQEGLAVHPNYFGGRVALGRAFFEKGRFAEARAEFVKVTQAAPDNLMALKLLGQIDLKLGNPEAAAKSFNTALLLDSRDEEAKSFLREMGMLPGEEADPEPEPLAAPDDTPGFQELPTLDNSLPPPVEEDEAVEDAFPPVEGLEMPGGSEESLPLQDGGDGDFEEMPRQCRRPPTSI